tara:strand:- start:2027 stop:2899 length:873 start_codon:yes stop_codon:yes gene_type:complete
MNFLSKYFEKRLETMGYQGLEVCLETRYDQLLGPAFYGSLEASLPALFKQYVKELNDAKRPSLYRTLYQRKQAVELMEVLDIAQTFSTFGEVDIKIDCCDRQNDSNPDVMELNHNFCDQGDLLDSIQGDSTSPDADTLRVQQSYPRFLDFLAWLESDIKDASSTLKEEGEQLMHAFSVHERRIVWSFTTEQLSVTACIQNVGLERSEHRFAFEHLQAVVSGQGCLYDLSVHIDYDNGQIGHAFMLNLDSPFPFETTTGREEGRLATLVYDAVAHAREYIATHNPNGLKAA